MPKYFGPISASRGLRTSSVWPLSRDASRSGAPVTRIGASPIASVAGPGGRLSMSASDIAMLSWWAARLTTWTGCPASRPICAASEASLTMHSMVPEPPNR